MQTYLDMVRYVLEHGEERNDRTGVGTISVFGYQARYDMREGFPLLTTKKVLFKAVVYELLWFLRGSTNINDDLAEHTPIWDAWADKNGELGPIYGYQWRNWGGQGIDQIEDVISQIKTNPNSRRLIVSAWNVGDVPKMALPPCHTMFQFYVQKDRLDCQLYQRSADIALGVPFNIASYALLTQMIANECGLEPGCFVHTLGDAHIYKNHIDGLEKQLTRTPKKKPTVEIKKIPLFEIAAEDIVLNDYVHDDFIRFKGGGLMRNISIIVACDSHLGIGINGTLPWRVPADMRFFKETTIGNGRHAVFMGRKTWDSIDIKYRPLTGRKNIVLSRSPLAFDDSTEHASSISEAVDRAGDCDKIFCIGGATIYKEVLDKDMCSDIWLTQLDKKFQCDVFFPEFMNEFKKKRECAFGFDNGINYQMSHWARL